MTHASRCLLLYGLLGAGLAAVGTPVHAQGRLSYPQSKAFRRVKQVLGDVRARYKRSFGAVEAAGTKAADIDGQGRARLASSATELEKLFGDVEKTVKDASLPRDHGEVAPVLAEVADYASKVAQWRAALSDGDAGPAPSGAPFDSSR